MNCIIKIEDTGFLLADSRSRPKCRELRYYLISSYLARSYLFPFSYLISFIFLLVVPFRAATLPLFPHNALPCTAALIVLSTLVLSLVLLCCLALPRLLSFTASCSLVVFLPCFHSRSPYCSPTYINLHTSACILHSDLLVNSPLVSCS